jgi:hypothetical protein
MTYLDDSKQSKLQRKQVDRYAEPEFLNGMNISPQRKIEAAGSLESCLSPTNMYPGVKFP